MCSSDLKGIAPETVVGNGTKKASENYRSEVLTQNNTFGNVNAPASIVPTAPWNYDFTVSSSTSGGYTTNTITRQTDIKHIYDFGDGVQKDNLTPTKATYEVRFQNTKDAEKTGGATGKDNLRAAHLSRVKLKSTFDDNITKAGKAASEKVFRLQNVYVPAYLVRDGGNNANQYTDHAHCADHRDRKSVV